MELSKRTLGVLKLFASVNPNLVFKTGTKQRTIATDEGVFVEAEFDEDVEKEFAICDLATFLRNLEAAENTSLTLGEKGVTISSKDVNVNYGYGSVSVIKQPPDKSLDIDTAMATFNVTKDQIALIMRFAEINSLPTICVGSDGTNFYLSARDKNNQDSVNVKIAVGEAPAGASWEEQISFDRFSKISPIDYSIKVVAKAFTAFIGSRLSFFVAVER